MVRYCLCQLWPFAWLSGLFCELLDSPHACGPHPDSNLLSTLGLPLLLKRWELWNFPAAVGLTGVKSGPTLGLQLLLRLQ